MSSWTASCRVWEGGRSRPFSSRDAASSQARNAATSWVRVVAENCTAWSVKASRLRRAVAGSSPGSAASSMSSPSTVSTSWITVVSSSPSTSRRALTSASSDRSRRMPSGVMLRPREDTQPSRGRVSSASIRLEPSTASAITTSPASSPVGVSRVPGAPVSEGVGPSPRAARSCRRSSSAAQSPSAARSRAPRRQRAPASSRARASERPGSVSTCSMATTSLTSGVCSSPPSPTTS